MKKILSVFILLLLLLFIGCKSVVRDNVSKTVLEVEKKKKGILFFSQVNGEFGWFETVEEKRGVKYVGEIKNGKPNGQGTLNHPVVGKYEGDWKDGKQNGQGTMFFPDGEKYEGGWKDGKQNGQGTFTSPDGIKYEGEIKDGRWNGLGTFTFGKGKFEGERFVGKFKYSEIWTGIIYDKDGNIIEKYVNGVKH